MPVNVLAPFPGAEDAAGTTRDLKKLRTITGAWVMIYFMKYISDTESP